MNAYEFSLAITRALKEKWGWPRSKADISEEAIAFFGHEGKGTLIPICYPTRNKLFSLKQYVLDYTSLDNILPALRAIEKRQVLLITCKRTRELVRWYDSTYQLSGKGDNDRTAARNLLATLCGVEVPE